MRSYKKSLFLSTAGLVAATLLNSQAFATPTIQGSDLQNRLNSITQGNSPNINVNTDQINQTGNWAVGASTGSETTFMFENVSGYTFGIYDPNDINNTLVLFDGSSTKNDTTSLNYAVGGNFTATYLDSTNHLRNPAQADATFSQGNLFGYYLTNNTTGDTYYSLASLNDQGMDHMAAIKGNGQTRFCADFTITCNPQDTAVFGAGEFILAWDGQAAGQNNNFAYNDFVVMVESVDPSSPTVPEPHVLGLFGLGLLLMSFAPKLNSHRELSFIAA
ncbi:hypothetical protein [Candidatus Nitrosacidococcus sp. I8]|uniref:hypothetical protein n=1 Tax=Candidatus Nitrosacidococcus sp. I8 TaxID=2942908 RepID=UPI002225C72A|nr:hypothetical protein [Candidatus Nitrosacidococcus sp. I8]CAH9018549.1 hypothetical protein NURINAE_00989 [Candidatus Nitrosacidococcus sp. I8]